jgi:hypothetical protein
MKKFKTFRCSLLNVRVHFSKKMIITKNGKFSTPCENTVTRQILLVGA